MGIEKERVDVLAVQQGLFTSREQAKRAIMAGEILGANEQRMDKAGEKIPVTTELHLKGAPMPYVSRGGFKLEKALRVFNIDVSDKIILDIGSSTGGFTDVSLQNGAKLVYALDVGTNQLVWSLRSDERVVVMENTNFRYSQLADFQDGQPEVATIDVSFISLNLILPPLSKILVAGGSVATLIKPQFEAGREAVGKHGIVKDAATHSQVIDKVADYAKQAGFSMIGLDYSPIKGGSGNIEFLAHLVLDGGESTMTMAEREAVVQSAHAQLNAHHEGKIDEKN
ncbi:TlyA family RNA methyltransferase [Weissella paramesenteroides]|jgi:23S rRNA (cytidine1920-2'-O)/16S rRNA (cytidine1409-2'-O)-methyltransferase|uniref:TlyA family RNA methyltransferase n=1 Tax=Weissella paramesenteroides TaxID=1249 RepID=UPI0023F85EDF|nr:TlyA family RNA methyltransferase [Weissella paramesenteroides]MDF8366734.1 TlyA family RNA methyltransferase [Weissella paramesenteroides]MDF8372738.1 TlyA family RNA methyltransferase [Weissella paramesenteroides]WIG66728.1 TlyA family RNA methyltransferase [Weissella paramesenteroides]